MPKEKRTLERDCMECGKTIEITVALKEEGYTSRSEFFRHAIRYTVEHPGASRAMLADIAASEYAIRKGEGETY